MGGIDRVEEMHEIVFSPSDFVAVLNQTLDYAYPLVILEGELANLRISRGKWVYFDIKDEFASVKCFGTVYLLPGPLEEGMMVRIVANPRMHPLYNFSLNLQSVAPIGEGSIKRASDLLFEKLDKEGLFDKSRKRNIPYAPENIGLLASKESAAYADFTKILDARWGGIKISHYDVQVQGESAVEGIVQGISRINQLPNLPVVLVITRGGGSKDDLAIFNNEQIVRAIAGSRIPTIVAIGHEIDTSLSELVADLRASTPSNAAELLVPDKRQILQQLIKTKAQLPLILKNTLNLQTDYLQALTKVMITNIDKVFLRSIEILQKKSQILSILNPKSALERGYAIVRKNGLAVKTVKKLQIGDRITLVIIDGSADATINKVN